jgi:hypothetical protein
MEVKGECIKLYKKWRKYDQNPIRLSQKRENYAKSVPVFLDEALWGDDIDKTLQNIR